jgi:hypothetical protein
MLRVGSHTAAVEKLAQTLVSGLDPFKSQVLIYGWTTANGTAGGANGVTVKGSWHDTRGSKAYKERLWSIRRAGDEKRGIVVWKRKLMSAH